jgi:hypothetical protein
LTISNLLARSIYEGEHTVELFYYFCLVFHLA